MHLILKRSHQGSNSLLGFLGGLFLLGTFCYGKESDWEFKSNQDDISIFQRQLPDSPLLEIKGQIRVNAPLATVLGVIGGSEHWVEWMPRTTKAQIIKKKGQGFIFYAQYKGWGPIWDREVYLLMSVHCVLNQGLFSPRRRVDVRFTTEDAELKQFPESEGPVVRMPKMIGHWYVWSAELPTKTYVEYQAYVDAGGQLIDFIKNEAARRLVKQALRNLQKQVQKYPEPDLEHMQKEAPSLFPGCLSLPAFSSHQE